ncbi:MAG: type I-U CRISPR-associated helicase/endonuclease Cas3 [Pirellulaceae bacterium]|nr:MAG: type I-U CRISPR-associated helicase/endonuclease Cas3 [Pirellulaceae bacterium]
MSVTPDQFADFFREVYRDRATGQTFEPFPWQERLARRVCAGKATAGKGRAWPDALALPTGSGKTACIDIAVFALACQADLPTSQRTAPRRILFVVDRRVIVDEAFCHALELARRLDEATDGILKEVADSLRKLAGSDKPLTCHQLRGGLYRDDAWARTPTQPCVIASTVDQIGSRILFRAYGRSFKSWPVHAGLAGNDSLILLDEAHCARPFMQTVQSIARYRDTPWAEQPLRNPFQVVILSATPPPGDGEIFTADDQDRAHPVLGARLNARKPTRLCVASKATGTDALRELAVALVEEAFEHVSEDRLAVAILVNRVQAARLVYELLRAVASDAVAADASGTFDPRVVKKLRSKLVGRGIRAFDQVLFTGRMRPIDRQQMMDEWLERLNARRAGCRQLQRPVFVAATQCLEVGANLDFDVMVSEAASIDALRQRFGRLNRTGRPIDAVGSVVIRQDQLQAKEPDPIYGEALAATWKQLQQWAKRDVVDFGVAAMEAHWNALCEEQQRALLAPTSDAPVMLPAHVDCWVQTSPEPQPTPDVSIFLHGPQHAEPDIQVCWRADLPAHDRWPLTNDTSEPARLLERDLTDAVSLCPPTTLECLPVPRHLFLRWWQERAEDVSRELADVDSSSASEAGPDVSHPLRAVALIWRGPRDSRLLRSPRDLKPGDTVVLPASIGGWNVLGHVPVAPEQPIDVADRCQWQARRRAVVRLREELLGHWPETESGALAAVKEALKQLAEDADAAPDREQLLNWLREIAAHGSAPPWLREAVDHGLSPGVAPEMLRHPFGGLVLRARRQVPSPDRRLVASETFSTDDDTASATEQVTLQAHSEAVARRARHYAELCHLDKRLAATLELAGYLHDLGKADRRYQAFLFGGQRRVADLASDVFAKSAGLRDNRRSYDEAWTNAGLPEEFRHEMLSVQLAEHCQQLTERLATRCRNSAQATGNATFLDQIDHDLLLHLVAMHHGYGRPLAPVVIDSGDDDDLALWLPAGGKPLEISAAVRRAWRPPHRLDSGVPERFWRLVRRYGWWGLAWLEAIFVLADHRSSEAEADQPAQPDTPGIPANLQATGVSR